MTIKRNGDRVILKNGKVSCSCCGGPECCMYPAQALADGDYAASDLPNTVTIGGVGYSLSGTSYGNTTNGVIFEGTVWAKYTNGARSSRPCLIQGGVEDQFADTYTASGVPAPGGGTESVSLSRISLCVWQGFDSCGGPVLLSYDGIAEGSGGPFGTYHWFITWQEYPFFNLFGCNSTPEGYGSEKTDPQSSPAGTYEGNATITVS